MSPSAIVWLCYYLFVLVPIGCYWLYQLYIHKDEQFIQKRNVKMTLALNISLLSFVIFQSVSIFNSTVGFRLLFVSIFSWWYCVICKTWIIFFDYQWTYYTLSSEWTSIINAESSSTNWYLQKRKTFGNLQWIAKVLAPIFIIFGVSSYLASLLIFTGNYTLTIIGSFLLILPGTLILITYIVILCKTPHLQRIDDIFHIHYESNLLAKVYGIGLIIFFVCFLLSGSMSLLYPNGVWVSQSITAFVLPSYVVMGIYPSTKLIVDKNKRSSSHIVDTKQMTTTNNMTSILANKDALYLFVLHLSHEYSLEILLCMNRSVFVYFCEYKMGLIMCCTIFNSIHRIHSICPIFAGNQFES
eukprot:118495_1